MLVTEIDVLVVVVVTHLQSDQKHREDEDALLKIRSIDDHDNLLNIVLKSFMLYILASVFYVHSVMNYPIHLTHTQYR